MSSPPPQFLVSLPVVEEHEHQPLPPTLLSCPEQLEPSHVSVVPLLHDTVMEAA